MRTLHLPNVMPWTLCSLSLLERVRLSVNAAAMTPPDLNGFGESVVAWQKVHGRNSLPWQNTRDPYKVWLSEIMLQQTQVATVLNYYTRFLSRFPAVGDLAAAQTDDVLALWSGLGYYSRARHMHRCAQDVVALHAGQFPRSAALLQTLPGIGPSTAAAIASFCFAERVAILDGNVKRVLTRLLAFEGDLADGAQERLLWGVADSLLPRYDLKENMPRYTQGVMDLGATLCTRRKPKCTDCPVQAICEGFAGGEPQKYPIKTRKLKRSTLRLSLLWAQRPDGSVWLERRPVSGIWGGLYCLPVFDTDAELTAFVPQQLHDQLNWLEPFKHVLTHKDLCIHPVRTAFAARQTMPQKVVASGESTFAGAWFGPQAWSALGLPAPIRKLLETSAA